MEAFETYQHEGVEVKLFYDDTPSSPREWDNLGTMVCWHRRANLGDETVEPDNWYSIQEMVESFDARVIIPLWLYEHGSMTMRAGDTNPYGDPWDSGQVGFIYVTADTIREEYGVKRITSQVVARVESCLRGEVETYDQYLRGDVYGFVVDDGGPDEDSCWGFYGEEYVKEEANSIAEWVAKARRAPDRIYVDAAPVEETLYAMGRTS